MPRHRGTHKGRCQEDNCRPLRILRKDGRMPLHASPGTGYIRTRPICPGSYREPRWKEAITDDAS